MEKHEVETTIVEIINDYTDFAKDAGAASIDELLNMRDRLAQHSYFFAEIVANHKQQYNEAYFMRKITISKRTQGFINARGWSKAQAAIQAENETEGLAKDEQRKEAAAYRADLLLKQINKVLDAMQQRISFLKQENNREQFTGERSEA